MEEISLTHDYFFKFYTIKALKTECLDQVQIDFPMRLDFDYANRTWEVLGNSVSFGCPNWAHSTVKALNWLSLKENISNKLTITSEHHRCWKIWISMNKKRKMVEIREKDMVRTSLLGYTYDLLSNDPRLLPIYPVIRIFSLRRLGVIFLTFDLKAALLLPRFHLPRTLTALKSVKNGRKKKRIPLRVWRHPRQHVTTLPASSCHEISVMSAFH